MSVTLYTATVPTFVRMLGNMDAWLEKAEAHAEAKKFDPSVYLASRFAPDMLPFPKQIQIACDMAKSCVARVAGVEAPTFADAEATIGELRERIGKTIDFVRSVPADKIVGAEERTVTVPRRGEQMTMTAQVYVERFVLPNFYFHATTTYALLRQNGVAIGKGDFLGAFQD